MQALAVRKFPSDSLPKCGLAVAQAINLKTNAVKQVCVALF